MFTTAAIAYIDHIRAATDVLPPLRFTSFNTFDGPTLTADLNGAHLIITGADSGDDPTIEIIDPDANPNDPPTDGTPAALGVLATGSPDGDDALGAAIRDALAAAIATLTKPVPFSPAALAGSAAALDYVGHRDVFDVSETEIADAFTNLMHLAWQGTNDDGEGMSPDDLIDLARLHFEAEKDGGDDLANAEPYEPSRSLIARRQRLARALQFVDEQLQRNTP